MKKLKVIPEDGKTNGREGLVKDSMRTCGIQCSRTLELLGELAWQAKEVLSLPVLIL